MGLILFIAKGSNCTNGGISSRFNQVCAVNVPGPFKPSEDCPAVLLESHAPGCLRIVPRDKPATNGGVLIGPMFSGNYAATSDGRFADACEKLLGHRFYGAVCIHDRFETPQEYEILSR